MTESLETTYKMQPWIDGESIDREVAESNACPECGGRCIFRSERAEGSYRAFAVCIQCDNEIEF